MTTKITNVFVAFPNLTGCKQTSENKVHVNSFMRPDLWQCRSWRKIKKSSIDSDKRYVSDLCAKLLRYYSIKVREKKNSAEDCYQKNPPWQP